MTSKKIRINKFLSMCGVTSRRGAETLIKEKKVVLNDKTVEELGVLIDPDNDVVKVNGSKISIVEEEVYVILNKPPNVMTTLHDPFKRKTILNYLGNLPIRVYPIGRLDYDSEGVLLLTNDGDLAFRLAHPKYQVEKIYETKVKGHFTPAAAEAIEKGIRLEDGAVGKAKVAILGRAKNSTRVRLILTEGRKREVKQLCKAVGHPVMHLRRVEFAGVTAHGLKLGKWRYLTPAEVEALQNLTK